MSRPAIAFTGPQQLHIFEERLVLATLDALPSPEHITILTGGCVGLDEFVATTMHQRGYTVHTVLPAIHRLVDPKWWEHCTTHETTALRSTASETYRLRNTRMVGRCDKLIAFIRNGNTAARSGEVMTYNIARKAGKTIEVIAL